MNRRLRILLAALGMTLAAWQWGGAAWLAGKAVLAQQLLEHSWRESVRTGEAPAPWPWADFAPVARLEAPALGVERIVLSNATPRTLAFGPGRLAEGAMPGSPGAVVLAGHRDTHFRFLREMRPGMELTLATRGEIHRYRVVETRVLDSRRDTLLLDGPERLVLLTCWPFDALTAGGPFRYAVIAEPVRDLSVTATRKRSI